MIYSIMVVVQVVVALTLVGLILVQHGKGADAGAAFGSGASGTVFGAQGTANFLSRATAGLATLFFVVSLSLAYLVNDTSAPTGSVTDQLKQPAPPAQTAPRTGSKPGSGSGSAPAPGPAPQSNGGSNNRDSSNRGASGSGNAGPATNNLPQPPQSQQSKTSNNPGGRPDNGKQQPNPNDDTGAKVPQ